MSSDAATAPPEVHETPSASTGVAAAAPDPRTEFATPADMHDEAGVDLSQIDMMLAMTPRERLRFLYETAESLGRLMPDAETD